MDMAVVGGSSEGNKGLFAAFGGILYHSTPEES